MLCRLWKCVVFQLLGKGCIVWKYYSSRLLIHVQYCQQEIISEKQKFYSTDLFYLVNGEIFWTIRQESFLSDNCISLVRVTPLQVCRFNWLILFSEWKNFIYYPSRRVLICSIRRMENIMLNLTYCVLHPKIASHYISDNDPLQAFRFGRFLLFGEGKNFICNPTSRVSTCSIRRTEYIMLDLTYCALHPKIASH